ncbi:MAG: SDR family NAD(P)-dependent oxidoreductase [Negativicutes bacterium]
MIDLKDKVAIVTGAGKGLGYATVKKFIELEAKVSFCDIKQEIVDHAIANLAEIGPADGYVCDVSDKAQVAKMVKVVGDKYGRIDVLINNAGIVKDAQFYKMTDEQFERVINVNLMGTYYFTKAVVPYMIKRNFGKIVNISSISAINGNFGQCNYAASKNGIIGFTRVLGKELGKFNINVNAILPGSVESEMTVDMPLHLQEMRIKSTALKRLGVPEDIANANAFLCSEWARHITAQTLTVDAGRS